MLRSWLPGRAVVRRGAGGPGRPSHNSSRRSHPQSARLTWPLLPLAAPSAAAADAPDPAADVAAAAAAAAPSGARSSASWPLITFCSLRANGFVVTAPGVPAAAAPAAAPAAATAAEPDAEAAAPAPGAWPWLAAAAGSEEATSAMAEKRFCQLQYVIEDGHRFRP